MIDAVNGLRGDCHCGAIEVRFASAVPLGELAVRACDCRFCRNHGARCVSDPAGHVEIIERVAGRLGRYRFGLKTADFLVCRDCGAYLAAVLADEEGCRATVNVANLDRGAERWRRSTPASYAGETRQQRIERRRRLWTPCTVSAIGQR